VRPASLWLALGLVALARVPLMARQPSAAKIPGTAIIVLTREFCLSEVRLGNSLVGKQTYRPGQLLCASAESIARGSFENVIRMETDPKPEEAGNNLILIPRFADMDATFPVASRRTVAILLDWEVKDPKGRVLWAQTVEGDAQQGGISHRKVIEMVMHDLVVKSSEAIRGSSEIRRYVETTHRK
jgi:hypothetical protein